MMKQYWRVGTIRQIFGVVLGMFVLGRYYYGFIPVLQDMGLLGAVVLATALIILFLFLGYLYDVKGKLWNEQLQVLTERDPYSYVPQFRFLMMEYPIFHSLVYSLKSVLMKLNLDHKTIDDLGEYLDSYFALQASNIGDIRKSIDDSENYMSKHPFVPSAEKVRSKTGIIHRLKKGFQMWVWRLTWANNFTGLAQDVLIFGSLYIGILIEVPDPVDGVTPIITMIYGILYLSIPLYLGLIIAGWYYDKRLRLWSPTMIVAVERTPYSYVPDPAMLSRLYPFLHTYLKTFLQLADVWKLDKTHVLKIVEYLDKYWEFSADKDEDMENARQLRRELGQLFSRQYDGGK